MKTNNYYRITAALLSVILCLSAPFLQMPPLEVLAESTTDGLEYVVDENQTVTITGYNGSETEVNIPEGIDGYPVTEIANNAFEKCRNLTNIIIPDTVTSIDDYAFSECSGLVDMEIPKSVINLGTYAFYNCFRLEKITIQEGITEIGDYVFSGCSKLENISLPKSLNIIGDYTFENCVRLANISLPQDITHIGYNAFYGCSSLTGINIPESVTSIEACTFYGCSSLTHINLPEGITYIEWSAFSGCSSLTDIIIPENVSYIGGGAFSGCSSLTGINIPDGVTSIEERTFYSCSSLTNINIPKSVTSIGRNAFTNCIGLTNVNILEGVTSIEQFAFSGCSSLTSINIPEGVTSIAENAFFYCSSLASITIPEGVTSIGRYAFADCSNLESVDIPESIVSIEDYTFSDCSSLTHISLPEGVTNIGRSAFSGCSSLANINIPKSLTSLEYSLFSGCSSLTNINIPERVTSIKSFAFSGCSGLNNIIIPESVTSIGEEVFSGCSSLTSITIPENVTSIGSSAFSGCSNLNNINIPEGVTVIESNTFSGCSSLTNIKIPESVTNIGRRAFYYCNQLKNLVIPESVTSIESEAFDRYNINLWCYSNSYAEQYAKDNNFPYNGKLYGYRLIDRIESYFDWITLSQEEYVYDGTAKAPTVSIEGMTQGTDFAVSYSNNTNAGTGTVTLTGKGNYSGTVTKDFIIKAIEIKEDEKVIELSKDTYEYDGTEKQPEVTIPGLELGKDYEVTYDRNINAGEATVTVTCKGNYSGVLKKSFTILPKSIQVFESNTELSQNTYEYDGTVKQPGVTITGLTRGSDFIVSYENNVNAGTATVTVTGRGNYDGTITKKFTITPKSMENYADKMSLSQYSYEYDGTEKQPKVRITGLVQGQDYEVIYDTNINVGKATVTVTGKGNYCDTITNSFTITAKAIGLYERKMSLSQDIYEYDGTQKEPVVTIEGLVLGQDFDVAYANNMNVGTATVTVSGKGNYDGTINKLFFITEKSIENYEKECKLSQDVYEYDGTEKKPTVTIEGLTEETDFEVAYSNNVDVGIAIVTIIGKGNLDQTLTKAFIITPKSIDGLKDSVKLSQTTYDYDGTAKEPTVTVEGLIQGKDFEVGYADNVDAGTATVTVTGKGNYTETITKTFVITPKPVTDFEEQATLSDNSCEYDGTPKQPMVTIPGLMQGKDYELSYDNNVNAGNATVTLTGKGNYSGSISKNFIITARAINYYDEDIMLSESTYAYDGTAREPQVTIQGLVQGQDYEVAYSNHTNAGSATVTITGKGNYSGTTTKFFTITAKAIGSYEEKVMLSQDIFEYDGTEKEPAVTVEGLVNGTDYEVLYANHVNAGTATVTIAGKGNYTGTITKFYTITAKSVDKYVQDLTLSQTTYEYDGTEKKPTVTIAGLTEGTDFEVNYSNNIDAGNATVTIIGKGNLNQTITKIFTITPKSIDGLKDSVKISQTTYDYDGTAKEPEVTIEGLMQGRDFEVSYANNMEVGTATVTINGQGNYAGSIQLAFVINALQTPTPDPQKPFYGDLNNSGVVDASDALQVLRFAAKLETPTEEQVKAGDVDGNGVLEAADALEILRKAAKLNEHFAVEEGLNSETAKEM